MTAAFAKAKDVSGDVVEILTLLKKCVINNKPFRFLPTTNL